MAPGCGRRYSLEYHHIRPWREGGESVAANGIVLCKLDHGLADSAILPVDRLLSWKNAPSAKHELDEYDDDDLLDPLAWERVFQGGRLEFYAEGLGRLEGLRWRLDSRQIPVTRVQYAIASLQLILGGCLTSLLRSDLPIRLSDRFKIELFAAHARRIGNKLNDYDLLLRANHVLAVNANATRRMERAVLYCNRVESLLGAPLSNQHNRAYLLRNIGLMLAKAGETERASALIQRADAVPGLGRSDWVENRVRGLQVALLANEGGWQSALEEVGTMSGRLSQSQVLIHARIMAVGEAMRGNLQAGLDLLDAALERAKREEMGHQCGRLRYCTRYLASGTFEEFRRWRGRGKAARTQPSRGFVQLF